MRWGPAPPRTWMSWPAAWCRAPTTAARRLGHDSVTSTDASSSAAYGGPSRGTAPSNWFTREPDMIKLLLDSSAAHGGWRLVNRTPRGSDLLARAASGADDPSTTWEQLALLAESDKVRTVRG